ncbi:MAG: glycosyltransferase family 1 protein [Ferruginibacter sp.]
MKVAINCWILRNKQIDGIGYFTINAISRMIRNNPAVEFQLLCDKNFTEDYFDFPNAVKYRVFPALRHPVLYVIYMEFILPFFLWKHRPDVFLSADGFLCLSTSIPQVSIIYDINFEHRPQDIALKNRLYFRFFFRKFARKAKRIATISEYSKNDIVDFYKIDPAKIDNVSCGINSNFNKLSEAEKQETRAKWSEGKPYFFFVGSMHPRKNINRLIQAFELFKINTGADCKLLLGGAIMWMKSDIETAYTGSKFKNDILFTGRLSDQDLQSLLGASFALSFVPLFEGFGLPVVEAMSCEVPIICSNTTSLPEVAGDATLLVDPFKIEDIAAAMEKLYNDPALCAALVEKGRLQRQKFTWDNTAKLLWNTVLSALNKNHQ